jgi:hypothetical protein
MDVFGNTHFSSKFGFTFAIARHWDCLLVNYLFPGGWYGDRLDGDDLCSFLIPIPVHLSMENYRRPVALSLSVVGVHGSWTRSQYRIQTSLYRRSVGKFLHFNNGIWYLVKVLTNVSCIVSLFKINFWRFWLFLDVSTIPFHFFGIIELLLVVSVNVFSFVIR